MRQTPPALLDVHEAFRAVVHDFDVAKMAAALGIPTGTLYNKANLGQSTSAHKPTLADAVLVQATAGDTRIVQAMAHALGGVFVALPKSGQVASDVALLEMVADISIMNGYFHSELKAALANGKFSGAAHLAIKSCAQGYVATILGAVNRIEGMVDA